MLVMADLVATGSRRPHFESLRNGGVKNDMRGYDRHWEEEMLLDQQNAAGAFKIQEESRGICR
jgi:hypothetical protein